MNRKRIVVTLEYQSSQHLDVKDDYDDFILTVSGTIYGESCYNGTPGSKPKTKLGEVKLMVVQVGNALNAGMSLFELFHTHQQTHDIGSLLFDELFEDHSSWIKRHFDDAFVWDDVLVLDRLTIDPAVRGQGLGLVVLDRVMSDWSRGCSLVAMKPFPLQYEAGAPNMFNVAELKLEKFKAGKAESFRRLRAYYSKLGFERIGRSKIYVLSTHNKRPSLKDLSLPKQFSVPAEFVETLTLTSNGKVQPAPRQYSLGPSPI
jgi:hypothetical protein